MTNYIATASDVRLEINTGLDDATIEQHIARVRRDIEREYDTSDPDLFDDDAHQRDFEATLAAYRIATGPDRRVDSEDVASVSVEYEGDELAALKSRVARLDPGTAFHPTGTVTRDTDRFVRSVSRSTDE